MSDHNYFRQGKEIDDKKKELHPVWRGFGFLIMIITPIISWAASVVLVDFGKAQKWPFLAEMSAPIRFSAIFYQVPVVSTAANYLSSISYLVPLVLFFILFLGFFTGIFSFINAVIYRLFGPSRYSELDAPAPRVHTKRYKR